MTEPLDDARGELLACPLCQSNDLHVGSCYQGGSSERQAAVRCAKCGCRSTLLAWNTRAAPARCDAESDLASFIPITGPGVDALENRKESDSGPSEDQVNADLRRYLVLPPSEAGRLRQALERSVVAIDDWLNTYAPDLCNEYRVKEAAFRISEHGTLWYIASVQEQNRAALSPDPGTVAVASAQYRCTCGAEPYCAPNVHAASCPLAVTSAQSGGGE